MLGKSQEELVKAQLYDVLYAYVLTYDCNSDILQVFFEAWCPKQMLFLHLPENYLIIYFFMEIT